MSREAITVSCYYKIAILLQAIENKKTDLFLLFTTTAPTNSVYAKITRGPF